MEDNEKGGYVGILNALKQNFNVPLRDITNIIKPDSFERRGRSEAG